jgi:hypothetical protein
MDLRTSLRSAPPLRKRLFSFDGVYLDGLVYLGVSQVNEPWNGLLVCTSREHHAAITAQFPQLTSHPVLGKWLYISQLHPDFESIVPELVEMTAKRDPRIDVEPRPTRKEPKAKGRNEIDGCTHPTISAP